MLGYITKINFIDLILKNVSTRNFKLHNVTSNIFLLDSIGLDYETYSGALMEVNAPHPLFFLFSYLFLPVHSPCSTFFCCSVFKNK